MATSFDTVVIGGGPAGSATAICLARQGASVVMVEATRYDGLRIGNFLPVTARAILAELGTAHCMADDAHVRTSGIQVAWGRDDLDSTCALFAAFGVGWHVDRARFDAALAECAREHGADLLTAATVTHCQRRKGHDGNALWDVQVAMSGSTRLLRGRTVVDASGRNGTLARPGRRMQYDCQVAMAATARAATPMQGATIEATENGWWCVAPISDDRVSALYVTDSDLLQPHLGDPGDYFTALLARTLHVAQHVGPRAETVPVQVVVVSSCLQAPSFGPATLLVGDAAAAGDPLMPLGIQHALESGLAGGHAIAAHLAGDTMALESHALGSAGQFAGMLVERASVHAAQSRWPDSPFWKRRLPPRYAEPVPRAGALQ